MRERFAKGTPVKIFFRRDSSNYVKSRGVSFRNVKYVVDGKPVDAIMFDCFISGDTDEKGLSIVALDNPEYCVYHCDPKHEDAGDLKLRDQIKQRGYGDGQINYGRLSIMVPACPY